MKKLMFFWFLAVFFSLIFSCKNEGKKKPTLPRQTEARTTLIFLVDDTKGKGAKKLPSGKHFKRLSAEKLYHLLKEEHRLYPGKVVARKGETNIYFGCHPFKDACYQAISPKEDANLGISLESIIMLTSTAGLALKHDTFEWMIPKEMPKGEIGIFHKESCRMVEWPPSGACFRFYWGKKVQCGKQKGIMVEGKGKNASELCRAGEESGLSGSIKVPLLSVEAFVLNQGARLFGKIIWAGDLDFLAAAEKLTGKKCQRENSKDEEIEVKKGIPEILYYLILKKLEPMDEEDTVVIKKTIKNGKISFQIQGFKCG